MRSDNMPRPFAPDHSEGTTHGEGCHTWGPRHYECAMRELARLRAEVGELDDMRMQLAGLTAIYENQTAYTIFHGGRGIGCNDAMRQAYSDQKVRAETAERERDELRAEVERLSGIGRAVDDANIASRIDGWFKAGRDSIAMLPGEKDRECPYGDGTLAAHWWSRGFASMARNFRAIEAERERDELRRMLGKAHNYLESLKIGLEIADEIDALVRLDAEEG